MRKIEFKKEGRTLHILVDGQPLRVKWDNGVIDQAKKAHMLYPKMKEMVTAQFRKILDDTNIVLKADEINFIMTEFKAQLNT